MPSAELSHICRDLSILGDSIIICCTKDGVRFSAKGDMGNGKVIFIICQCRLREA